MARPKGTVKTEAEKRRARIEREKKKAAKVTVKREKVVEKDAVPWVDEENYDPSEPLPHLKWERLAQEYVIDLDLERAALAVGYTYRTYVSNIQRNIYSNILWRKRVRYLAQKFADDALVTKGWVLEKLVDMWRYNAEECDNKMRDARVAMSALTKVGEHIDVGAYKDSGERGGLVVPNINISFGSAGKADDEDMVLINGGGDE